VWRARIVLLSAAGVGTMAIQRQTGKGKPTIWRWQARFMAEGVDGLLHEATRPPGKPPLTAAAIERVIEMTLAEPPGERTHWTGRAMAKAAGVSHRSVQRIWAAHGLKPHRVRTFKLSNDPKFAAKVQDVVGLYVDPPEHALVLSVDEKSQIQARHCREFRAEVGHDASKGAQPCQDAKNRLFQTPSSTSSWLAPTQRRRSIRMAYSMI